MKAKDKVFQILRQNQGKSISGSDIAHRLGITRAGVWKAIDALRAEGVQISAGTNRGYCLCGQSDILSEAVIRQYLNRSDVQVKVLDTCDSTNNVAKQLAMHGEPAGTIVVTETQTAGRGRLGRSFYSPGRGGVYMSVVLRPALPAYDSVLITAGTAVAVCRAIQKLSGIEAQIKWVNDIYIDGKKVCGILTEAATDFESGAVEYIVVGIGINVRQGGQPIPDELIPLVTTLEQHTDRQIGRCELIAAVANELETASRDLSQGTFLDEYRQRSIVLGKRVWALRGEERELVEVVDIDERAGLVVRGENGTVRTISSGEVSIRPV